MGNTTSPSSNVPIPETLQSICIHSTYSISGEVRISEVKKNI
jgi:hypothetical protein